jgi:hypothetical protein
MEQYERDKITSGIFDDGLKLNILSLTSIPSNLLSKVSSSCTFLMETNDNVGPQTHQITFERATKENVSQ